MVIMLGLPSRGRGDWILSARPLNVNHIGQDYNLESNWSNIKKQAGGI